VLQHLEFCIKSADRKHDSERPVIPNEGEEPGVTEIATWADEPRVGRKRCARLKLKVPTITTVRLKIEQNQLVRVIE
jgi:hypothetical protein